jgi:hypothetical protein
MAIKGKSKPKGGAKSVTRGPKPAYVPVRKPLFQRRSFWLSVLGLVIVASVAGIWYGVAKQRTADREEELAAARRDAATEYQQQVEPILATVGQPLPPSGFEVFPELSAQVSAFLDGSVGPSELDATASAVAKGARGAAADLEKVDAVGIVAGKGFNRTFPLYVLNSQDQMSRGLRLFEQAARVARAAAATEGEAATELAERASEIADIAAAEFAAGYRDYTEARFRAGIYQPTPTLPSP